jgi:hypothetical protein
MSNPYNAKIIPKNDVYGDVPLYGRFESRVDDFDPTDKTPQEILQLCGPANEMLPEVPVRRIYALGKVIIKGADFGRGSLQSHQYGDANEAAAIALVSEYFPEIPVPEIIFQGKVKSSMYDALIVD